MNNFLNELGLVIGIEQNTTSQLEKLLSGLGGFVGIGLCYFISTLYLDDTASLLIVASAGASAVLIFAVPHGALSQPWPVIGGHLISATVGVYCQQHIADTHVAAATAVGLAIFGMYHLRCLHPPGGATALFAVAGGSGVTALGYDYVVFPVLLNTLALVSCGVLFNALFQWRRYPGHWFHRRQAHSGSTAKLPFRNISPDIAQEDFAAALHQMNSFIDITPDDLSDLFELASRSARRRTRKPLKIEAGLYYSNAARGSEWAVREVLTIESKRVQFRIAAGNDDAIGQAHSCSTRSFRQWARCKVIMASGLWVPCESTND
jgi:CBS domain-containing membrane protein